MLHIFITHSKHNLKVMKQKFKLIVLSKTLVVRKALSKPLSLLMVDQKSEDFLLFKIILDGHIFEITPKNLKLENLRMA